MVIDTSGWLATARKLESPNQDDRPERVGPELLVIHNISLPPNQFGGPGIEQLFLNQLDPSEHPYYKEIHHLRVSAHLLIRRDGELVQFVPFSRRAWHAGTSCFQGRDRCNDFSIGIELEGSDQQPFEPVQYQQLAKTCKALIQHYPGLSSDRITGHSDIAPGRKTDPGPCFDWACFRQMLEEEFTSAAC